MQNEIIQYIAELDRIYKYEGQGIQTSLQYGLSISAAINPHKSGSKTAKDARWDMTIYGIIRGLLEC